MDIEQDEFDLNKYRTDPYSGEKFIPAKSNQRFANRKNQIAYNNRKATRVRKIKAPRQKALDSNFKILQELLGNKKVLQVSKEFLRGAKFNFKVCTSIELIDEMYFHYVFNYRFREVEKDLYEISKT